MAEQPVAEDRDEMIARAKSFQNVLSSYITFRVTCPTYKDSINHQRDQELLSATARLIEALENYFDCFEVEIANEDYIESQRNISEAFDRFGYYHYENSSLGQTTRTLVYKKKINIYVKKF